MLSRKECGGFDFNNSNDEIILKKLPKNGYDENPDFVEDIVEMLDYNYGGYFVLRYIIAELVNNVFDHSFFNKNDDCDAYIGIKEYAEENTLTICIMDNGISIPGAFDNASIGYLNDCDAIGKAINNVSTISNDSWERGNGLWSTIRFVMEGNGGEVLIVSRNASLHITNDNYKYYKLDNNEIFKGTLVSVKLNKFVVQHVYELLELPRTENYKYEVI